MNLHQFRFLQEAVRRNLNLTETAKALFTSQPGVSKAILELEEELGVDIFARHGKRLKRITEPGQLVLKSVEIIMREIANLKRIGEEFSKQDAGTLSIATTHTQARYFLPEPIAQLRRRYPKVQVVLHQGMPEQVARMLLDDIAEIGLATEALAAHPELVTLPCYEWQHVMVVPEGHALAGVERPTLEQLAAHPLVLYQSTVTGRTRIDLAFERAHLSPLVALEAIDSDVIKTYVRLGLGVGVVAESSMHGDPPDPGLVWRPLGHLFGSNVTRVAFKRGAYLRQFVLAFAEMMSQRLTPSLLASAMSGQGSDYEL
ncbi:MAG: CysB family HTH-type transcriptional regulator [Burkholderiales bacterium]|nr:CysB family HTH-type transcriptional regulator [Burkholderiales bacterium]MDE1929277.1 CysB family HTH-type transcriptional regulator [Burkholderiales bacterium]MDE2504109.1 CysB family HTH-type transcriptional regulator [Burkholderiales bacterium]